MNDTMLTISQYLMNNYSSLGLGSEQDIKLVDNPKDTLMDGAKLLIVTPIRSLPDRFYGVTWGNLASTGVKVDRWLTLLQIRCFTRGATTDETFYWNTARKLRDSVYDLLTGSNRGGITIDRYEGIEGEDIPTKSGQIWFEVDPTRNSPIEDYVEDPDDVNNKSIYLTYNVHWWKPI